jgi:uncharacterized membrane protein YdbT with pleckstrin-like domain
VGFPYNVLDPDEQVIRDLHPHWRRVALPVVLAPCLVGLASYAWFALPSNAARQPLRWAVLAIALVVLLRWSAWPFLFWLTTRYVVTDRRVIMRHGVLARTGRDIPLTRVNDVSFARTLLERVFGSGTLVIESAGDRGQVTLTDVPHVESVQRDIYRLVEAGEQRLR